MGTWAEGSFENDDALDWLSELYKNPKADLVRTTLERVVGKTKEERAWSGQEAKAVAAAAIVACWLGKDPPEPLRVGLAEWAQQNLKLTPGIVQLARQAVQIIKTDSDLRHLWAAQSKWLRAMDNLEQRLQ
jgi:hypothetical protein